MNEISDPEEYFERPKDISFLIDKAIELNKNNPVLKEKIDISRVGIIGHSFGGYTALVSAGAEIDIPYLRKFCPDYYPNILEIGKSGTSFTSFFQCRVIFSKTAENIDKAISFADPRIKACIAMAPVTSSIFGEEGLSKIKIPVMIMGGDRDTTVNYREEQIKTFPKLNPPKYLLILIGGNHISFNDEPEDVVKRYNFSKKIKDLYFVWGNLFHPPPEIDFKRGHLYINKFSTAFFDYYLKGNSKAKNFLTQKYADEISEKSGELLLLSQP
jgi:predicted dienelactone hydrolase